MIEYLLIPYMAIVYRMRGGKPDWPRPIEQLLYSLPYAIVIYLGCGTLSGLLGFEYASYVIAAIGLAITTGMVVRGHGHNMDLGTWTKPADYEWYEPIIKSLHGKIPEYWYDVLGLTVSGLTYTIPTGLLTLNPFLGLSGATKALAYMIGWKTKWKTVAGEYLTGAFAGLMLVIWIQGIALVNQ